MNVVDQRRTSNARRITRMGGVVAGDEPQRVEVSASELGDDPRVIRDASGVIVRRL